METVWTTFTWVRNIETWLAGYKLFRRSQIHINIVRSPVNDEAHPPPVWEFEYLVQQDLSGDTLVGKLEPGTKLAYIGPRKEAPKPEVYEPKIINSLRARWEKSENGGKAVEAVFGNWNAVKTQVGLLLRPV